MNTSHSYSVIDEPLLVQLKELISSHHQHASTLLGRALLRECIHFNVLTEMDFLSTKEFDQMVACFLLSVIANTTSVDVKIHHKVLKKSAQHMCDAAAYLQKKAQDYEADHVQCYSQLKTLSYLLLASANAIGFAHDQAKNQAHYWDSAIYTLLYMSLFSEHQNQLKEDLKLIQNQQDGLSSLEVTALFHDPQQRMAYVERCRKMVFFSADLEALILAYDQVDVVEYAIKNVHQKSVNLVLGMGIYHHENQHRHDLLSLRQRQEKTIYLVKDSHHQSSVFSDQGHTLAANSLSHILDSHTTLSLATLLSYNQTGQAINVNISLQQPSQNKYAQENQVGDSLDKWVNKFCQLLTALNLKTWQNINIDMKRDIAPSMSLVMLFFQQIRQQSLGFAITILFRFMYLSLWQKYTWRALAVVMGLLLIMGILLPLPFYLAEKIPTIAHLDSTLLLIEMVVMVFVMVQIGSFYSFPYQRFMWAKNNGYKNLSPLWQDYHRDLQLLLSILEDKYRKSHFATILVVIKQMDEGSELEQKSLHQVRELLAQYSFIEIMQVGYGQSEPLEASHEAIKTGFSVYLSKQECMDVLTWEGQIDYLQNLHPSVLELETDLTELLTQTYLQQKLDTQTVVNLGHLIILIKIALHSQSSDNKTDVSSTLIKSQLKAMTMLFIEEKSKPPFYMEKTADEKKCISLLDREYLLRHFRL